MGDSNGEEGEPEKPPVQQSAGPRASALQRVFSDALTHSLRPCSYDNFATCFPTPAEHEPDSLRELWRNFVRELDDRCRSNFDLLVADRAVVPALNALDELLADARRRKSSSSRAAESAPTPYVL